MGAKYSVCQGKVPRLGTMLSCVVWFRTRFFFHWLVNYRSNKYLAMTVRHVPDMSKGHKFECETEVTCAKTAKNTANLVVSVGKDILIPF